MQYWVFYFCVIWVLFFLDVAQYFPYFAKFARSLFEGRYCCFLKKEHKESEVFINFDTRKKFVKWPLFCVKYFLKNWRPKNKILPITFGRTSTSS